MCPKGEKAMSALRRKVDAEGRLTLPEDFAGCVVTVERQGDELRVRKMRRYSFKELMAGVTPENIHGEVSTGPPQGNEAL
jgi:antitoxin component of MazEF toxin-antitoxin module